MNFKDTEDFYKSLFDNALDGIAHCQMIFDAQGHPVDFKYLLINKNFEKLTGLKGVEGKNVTEVIPGISSSNPELFEIYGRVSLGGLPEIFEIYLKLLSIWFLVSVYCPKKGFFVAIFQNITEKKRIEKNLNDAKRAAVNVLEDLQEEKEELAYAKAKDEALLESLGEGILAIDQYNKVTVMNKVAEDILGSKYAEMKNKSFFNAVSLEDARGNSILDSQQPLVQSLTRETTTTTNTYYLIRKDKTKFPILITATPVILGSKLIGSIIVFRDISKEVEVDKAKTEFVSLASHQLRSPVTSIKWYAEMLLSGEAGKLNDKQKDYFDVIYRSNQKMIELIDALLNVSRLDLGTFTVDLEPTNIATLMCEVADDLKIAINEKNISLKVIIEDDLPTAKADPRLLRIVMTNLVSNAIKYSHMKGFIECSVYVAKKGELVDSKKLSEDSFVIKVSDKGYGIPCNQQGQIFLKFFRADNIRTLNTEGSGLGLYMVKSILDHTGGQIWFTSKENIGSTFYVTFPVVGMTEQNSTK